MRDLWTWIVAHAWIYAASMNLILAFTAVGLGVALTKGAGFHCPAALVRLVQRLGFLFLAAAMMNSALHTIQIEEPPSFQGFLVQVGFMWVLALSAARHFWWAPKIPTGASWSRPMHTFSYTGGSRGLSRRLHSR